MNRFTKFLKLRKSYAYKKCHFEVRERNLLRPIFTYGIGAIANCRRFLSIDR